MLKCFYYFLFIYIFLSEHLYLCHILNQLRISSNRFGDGLCAALLLSTSDGRSVGGSGLPYLLKFLKSGYVGVSIVHRDVHPGGASTFHPNRGIRRSFAAVLLVGVMAPQSRETLGGA